MLVRRRGEMARMRKGEEVERRSDGEAKEKESKRLCGNRWKLEGGDVCGYQSAISPFDLPLPISPAFALARGLANPHGLLRRGELEADPLGQWWR